MNGQADISMNPDFDELMDHDPPDSRDTRSRYSLDNIKQSISNIATVSEALRILGAAVMVASMSVFLLQGWQEGNDINRYLTLLAQTGLLALGGFVLSHGLKENKGARIFFGLALISIPANFTILGALLYSVVQWDGSLLNYPDYATWSIVDVSKIGFTFAGAMLALIPVAMLGFAIMARRSMRALSVHFLILNSLLLIPVRSSTMAGVIALLGVVYALFSIRKMGTKDNTLKTPEGRFSIVTLFIPLFIILFRSMYFYQIDSLLIAMLSLAVFLVLRQVSINPQHHENTALAMDLIAIPVTFVATSYFVDALEPVIASTLMAPGFALIFTLLSFDIIRRTRNPKLAAWVGAIAGTVTALSFIFNVFFYNSALTALSCVLTGLAMVLVGQKFKHHYVLIAGCLSVAVGIIFGVGEFVELIMNSSWVGLAVTGASAIAIASLLDRHGVSLRLQVSQWLDSLVRIPR